MSCLSGCGHPRQVTPDGGLMPCAYPRCVAGFKGAMLNTADLPPMDWTRGHVDIAATALPRVRQWKRVEWVESGDPETQWFWLEVR